MTRRTRTDDLRERLADEIITGQIAPGTRLDEHMLAERFGVSRTPIREVLRHLAAIGLATRGDQRSLYAAAITSERRVELFELMAELEALCARLAATRMTAQERAALQALHVESSERMKHGDRGGYADDNFRFHAAIYKGAHNAMIEEMAHQTRKRLAPFRSGQFNVVGRLGESFAEHQSVVDAILRGDAAAAAAAMHQHVALVSDASAVYVRGAGEARSVSR